MILQPESPAHSGAGFQSPGFFLAGRLKACPTWLLLLIPLSAGPVGSARAQDGRDLALIVNDYLPAYWAFRPVSAATPAGVHSQDKSLEDWSATAVQQEISRNQAFLQRLQKLDVKQLSPASRADRENLASQIRLVLADLADRNSASTRPDRYALLLGNAVWSLTNRQFAPATARFDAIDERLKQYPKVLKQAPLNFGNPAEIHTRKALEILASVADYLDKDVPNAAVTQGVEKKALSRVQKDSHAAAAAVRDFRVWMESQLLPRSKGNPLPSEKVYRQIFHDLLGTEMTPEEVLAAAEKELGAAPVPGPAGDALDSFQVMQAFRKQEREPRLFVDEKRIALIPMPDRLQFETAAPFSPRLTAVLDPAGAFEPDLGFFIYVPARVSLTSQGVKAALVRLGHPGGYLQRVAMNQTDSIIRKVFPNAAFIAGWEEYAAVLMQEAGYAGARDPAHDRAVWLDAIFDIRLHLGKVTPEDAIKQLTGQFACSPAEAQDRVWRALASPALPAAPFVGKLELLRLREDIHKNMGAAFILGEYHTRLLSLGAPSFAAAHELLQ
jgi:uncharacterized protein (DUF885 family)